MQVFSPMYEIMHLCQDDCIQRAGASVSNIMLSLQLFVSLLFLSYCGHRLFGGVKTRLLRYSQLLARGILSPSCPRTIASIVMRIMFPKLSAKGMNIS